MKGNTWNRLALMRLDAKRRIVVADGQYECGICLEPILPGEICEERVAYKKVITRLCHRCIWVPQKLKKRETRVRK